MGPAATRSDLPAARGCRTRLLRRKAGRRVPAIKTAPAACRPLTLSTHAGFKSYPVRTSISGWDSSFNAITGLNGSGKSNILDAICFVLGITNMSTVRASNLIDLIYKRGQAGVVRASVTIVFDNSDKSKAPLGFENMAEVSVTRQVRPALGACGKDGELKAPAFLRSR